MGGLGRCGSPPRRRVSIMDYDEDEDAQLARRLQDQEYFEPASQGGRSFVSPEYMMDDMFADDGFDDFSHGGGPQKIDEKSITDKEFFNDFDDDFDDSDV